MVLTEFRSLLILLCIIGITGFGGSSRIAGSLIELHAPVKQPSGQPFLEATPDGKILLSWIEQGGATKHAFRFSTYDGSQWSEPHTVAEGNDFFVNWADVPSVVKLPSGRFAAHWLKKSGEAKYAYDVQLKVSDSEGNEWSNVIAPHNDGTKSEHGFVSLFNSRNGSVAAVWLDGREKTMESKDHDDHAEDGNMTLRSAVISPEGNIESEHVLDGRVCDCCPTAAAKTETGVIIAYRDRSESEMRDIYVVRNEHGKWSKPTPVCNDGWQIPGCPVNGPALASQGKEVVICWFTAPNGTAQVNAAFSHDNGATFGKPSRVDGGKPLGRVDVELLPDGSALASWIEWIGENSEVKVCRIKPDGTIGESVKVTSISAERSSGIPRMVVNKELVFFAWTDVKGTPRVRVATKPLAEFMK